MATEIEIVDLTNGSIVNQEWVGTGVFDALMTAVNKNIEIQYQKGRITGQDYAQVYLGALQSTLQQSVEFLLRKELTEAQTDEARERVELTYTEKVKIDKEVAALGLDNVVKQSETSRLADPSFVYTPRYTEV
jgi:hypothetical protein